MYNLRSSTLRNNFSTSNNTKIVSTKKKRNLETKGSVPKEFLKDDSDDERKSKRIKREPLDSHPLEIKITSNSVSPSSMHNYYIDNTLADWLNMYYNKKEVVQRRRSSVSSSAIASSSASASNLSLERYVMKKGVEFEKYIIEQIPSSIDIVDASLECHTNEEKYLNTKKLAEKDTPIIYQAFVYNKENDTYGYIDLLVKNKYLPQLIKNVSETNDEESYSILDIKYTTIRFNVKTDVLTSGHRIPAYKAQLLLYRQALKNMGIKVSDNTYILGRGWIRKDIKCDNPFDRLGIFTYQKEDFDKLNKAMAWVRNLRTNGKDWSINPPSREELYPNLKEEDKWKKVKTEIANNIEDITKVYYCSTRHRKNAMLNEVYKWTNPKCDARLLGFNEGKIQERIDAILDINRSKDEKVSWSESGESEQWTRKDTNFNVYVDFETFSNIYTIDNCRTGGIYLIGNGIVNNNKWQFKYFLVEDDCDNEQRRIVTEWHDWLLSTANGRKIKLYHYSHAEPTNYDKLIQRLNIQPIDIEWIDLYKVVIDNIFVVKGCFNFSLKGIINALINVGEIPCIGEKTEVTCGSEALVSFFIALDECRKNREMTIKDVECIKESIIYNEKDCESLYALCNVLEKYL